MTLLLLLGAGNGSDTPVVAATYGSSGRLMLLGVSLLGYLFLG